MNNNFYNSILNNYLWFSDPKDFNDPYDLNLNLIVPNYNRDDISILVKLFKEKGIVFKNSDEEIINRFISNPMLIKETIQDAYLNKYVPEVGICCFSQTEYNLLMWSHYADKHHGICLKFDMDLDKSFFTIPLKVNYPDHYPTFDYLSIRKNQEELIQFFMGTKSIDWKYENEIRIVKYKQYTDYFRGKINFNKSSLVEVIFGYKIDKDTISNLKTLIQGISYNNCTTFSQVVLKKNEFGLKKIIVN